MVSAPPVSSIDWLSSRILFGMKAGLENISALSARLGNPHRSVTTVHIAGSNGKGSAASFLAELSTAAGIRTGLFTSPHLVSVRERFRIDGVPIGSYDFERLLGEVRRAAEQGPEVPVTFFEAITAVAFLWFREQRVELAVLEVGLGGRLDSTNLVDSRLTVLTGISLEHTDILGKTEEKILREKLGVTRLGGKCLFALSERLVPELSRCSQEVGFEPVPLSDQAWSRDAEGEVSVELRGKLFRWKSSPGLPLPMVRNRVLSLRAFDLLGELYPALQKKAVVSDEQLCRAVTAHQWTARYQRLQHPHRPDLWIDGAHNPEAVAMLSDALGTLGPAEGWTAVMGVVSDKNISAMIEALLPRVSRFLFVRTSYPRFRDPEELISVVAGRRECHSFGTDVEGALREGWSGSGPVVVCGSLYLMGEVIVTLRNDYDELAWYRQFDPDRNESR